MADSFTLRIVPKYDELTLDALESSLRNVSLLVRAVDYGVTRERDRPWIVESISAESPTLVTMRPAFGTTESIDVLVRGLDYLSTQIEAAGPPERWGDYQLERAARLQATFRKPVQELDFSANGMSAAVRDDIKRRVSDVRKTGHVEYGSLEGELDALNVRNPKRAQFTIWESIGGQPIRCYFKPKMLDQVLTLVKRRVLVAGQITYFRNGKPRSISDIRRIRDLAEAESDLGVESGSIPDLTGKMSTSEYLHWARGDG